jgi:hypothetical protein
MKTLLITLLLIPTIVLGQVSSWRNNPPQQPQTRVESPRVQPTTPQRNDVSSWRNNPPNPDPRGRVRIQNCN